MTQAGNVRQDVPPRGYAAALPALLALGFALRAWELGRDSLWYDEAVSVGIAHLPLREFFRAWANEVNSGLYYFFVRLLIPFGESEIFLRLTSVAFGLAAISVFARFVSRTFDRRTALLAAALLSFNVSQVFYAREIRGYAMLVFLVALAWLALERCLRDGGMRWFALWAALWVLAMYVHMFSLMVLAGQLCCLPFAVEFGQRWRQFLRALVWTGIGYTPMAGMIYYSHRNQIFWIPPLSWQVARRFFFEHAGRSHWLAGFTWSLFAVAAILFAVSLVRRERAESRFPLAVAVLGTAVPIALLALLSVVQPAFLARYAVQTAPTFALACAVALAKLPRRVLLPAVAVLAVLSFVAYREFDLDPPNYEQRNDYRAAAHYISASARPGDVIAVWGPQSRFGLEYYQRLDKLPNFPSYAYPGPDGDPGAAQFAAPPEVQQLDAISHQNRHIWLFLSFNRRYQEYGIYPHFFMRRLGLGHRLTSESRFRGATVYEYDSE